MSEEKKQIEKTEEKQCGLVMPISSIDGCNEQHWLDVKSILSEAVQSAGFVAKLVSYADDVGIIQKRIIQNLYENPIIVCDVSGKNPNVMFELGLRLAFDKPTIIVKDDETSYSFDTSPIEHLEYPRDLRFNKIVEFKKELAEKIKATYEKSINDSGYTTFLKHFGTFTVAKLDKKEVSKEDYIIEELMEIRKTLTIMHNKNQRYEEFKVPYDIISRIVENAEKNEFRDHLEDCENEGIHHGVLNHYYNINSKFKSDESNLKNKNFIRKKDLDLFKGNP
jgi:hypothetical protein